MRVRWHEGCQCKRAQVPSKACGQLEGRPGDLTFNLAHANETCHCMSSLELTKQKSTLVQVAAIRFCSTVVEVTATKIATNTPRRFQNFVRQDLKLTPELCSEVLTGTLDSLGTKHTSDTWHSSENRNPLAEANGVSKHGETKGLGHLDPLISAFPSPQKYQDLLHHVCRDECEKMVDETVENIGVMVGRDVRMSAKPFEELCADRVVRRAEAEILGCCGRSCGWDGRSCTSWPFFTRDEKVDWLEECCTEYNILNGSSRELMCDSVLSPQQVDLVSKGDTTAKEGSDVGGSYTGQDPPLQWTSKGLEEFKEQLRFKRKPKEGDEVTSEFLEQNPDVRQKGLHKKWFREEKVAEEKGPDGPTSLAQSTSCDTQKLHGLHHCPVGTRRKILSTCMREEAGWQVSHKPDPEDPDYEEDSCDMMIDSGKAKAVATPDDCLKEKFAEVGEINRRFFQYKNEAKTIGKEMKDVVPDKPIMCYVESTQFKCPKFERTKIAMFEFKKDFVDYLYWIDESKVLDRLQEMDQDVSNVNAALGV